MLPNNRMCPALTSFPLASSSLTNFQAVLTTFFETITSSTPAGFYVSSKSSERTPSSKSPPSLGAKMQKNGIHDSIISHSMESNAKKSNIDLENHCKISYSPSNTTPIFATERLTSYTTRANKPLGPSLHDTWRHFSRKPYILKSKLQKLRLSLDFHQATSPHRDSPCHRNIQSLSCKPRDRASERKVHSRGQTHHQCFENLLTFKSFNHRIDYNNSFERIVLRRKTAIPRLHLHDPKNRTEQEQMAFKRQ